MKQLITYILILLIVLQPLTKVVVYIDFKMNQESIAQTLCIQREVANNCCKGACYLRKKIEQAEKQEQKQIPELLKEKSEITYYTPQLPFVLKKHLQVVEKNIVNVFKTCLYASSFISSVFQPPESH